MILVNDDAPSEQEIPTKDQAITTTTPTTTTTTPTTTTAGPLSFPTHPHYDIIAVSAVSGCNACGMESGVAYTMGNNVLQYEWVVIRVGPPNDIKYNYNDVI